MENCEICRDNEACYICVCEEKHVCDQCLIQHASQNTSLKHRPVSISHPLLTLMMEATEEINQAAFNFTSESLEVQIKSLEELRERSNRLIEAKINALKQKLVLGSETGRPNVQDFFCNSPQRTHRHTYSMRSNSEVTKKHRSITRNMHEYKIILIGDAGVGKSEFIGAFASNIASSRRNSALNSASRRVVIDNNIISVDIWELSSENTYGSLSKSYCNRAEAVVLMYDLTRLETFQGLRQRIENVRRLAGPEVIIFIVGNKFDVVSCEPSRRSVSFHRGQDLARSIGGCYDEICARESTHVISLFKRIVKEIYTARALNKSDNII